MAGRGATTGLAYPPHVNLAGSHPTTRHGARRPSGLPYLPLPPRTNRTLPRRIGQAAPALGGGAAGGIGSSAGGKGDGVGGRAEHGLGQHRDARDANM